MNLHNDHYARSGGRGARFAIAAGRLSRDLTKRGIEIGLRAESDGKPDRQHRGLRAQDRRERRAATMV